MKLIWLVLATLSEGLLLGGNQPRAEVSTIALAQWPPPDIGMLGVTFFGLFLTPVFYLLLRGLSGMRPLKQHAEKPPTLAPEMHSV